MRPRLLLSVFATFAAAFAAFLTKPSTPVFAAQDPILCTPKSIGAFFPDELEQIEPVLQYASGAMIELSWGKYRAYFWAAPDGTKPLGAVYKRKQPKKQKNCFVCHPDGTGAGSQGGTGAGSQSGTGAGSQSGTGASSGGSGAPSGQVAGSGSTASGGSSSRGGTNVLGIAVFLQDVEKIDKSVDLESKEDIIFSGKPGDAYRIALQNPGGKPVPILYIRADFLIAPRDKVEAGNDPTKSLQKVPLLVRKEAKAPPKLKSNENEQTAGKK